MIYYVEFEITKSILQLYEPSGFDDGCLVAQMMDEGFGYLYAFDANHS